MNCLPCLWISRWISRWSTKWNHVKQFKVPHRFSYTDGNIYIHLYESKDGRRKIDVASTLEKLSDSEAHKIVLKSELYHERIVRWLAGRNDLEIPRYSECAADDTFNALKGVNE